MAVEITHPRYGTRTVDEAQVDRKLRVGWSAGASVTPPEVEGTVVEVLADVGDDPHKARVALAAEQDRPSPRTSLTTALARVIESNTEEI